MLWFYGTLAQRKNISIASAPDNLETCLPAFICTTYQLTHCLGKTLILFWFLWCSRSTQCVQLVCELFLTWRLYWTWFQTFPACGLRRWYFCCEKHLFGTSCNKFFFFRRYGINTNQSNNKKRNSNVKNNREETYLIMDFSDFTTRFSLQRRNWTSQFLLSILLITSTI